jgi:hypothetical protein
MTTTETFKVIPGYEDYKASNLGNILSTKTNKILKPSICKKGYKVICLSKNGKKATYKVGKLVFKAFYGYSPVIGSKNVIDYIDNNKENCNLSNLREISKRIDVTKDLKKENGCEVGASKVIINGLIKFQASIYVDGKQYNLGRFNTPEKASLAYRTALDRYYKGLSIKNINNFN